jgi:BMFP domain-containing protein YqiC
MDTPTKNALAALEARIKALEDKIAKPEAKPAVKEPAKYETH